MIFENLASGIFSDNNPEHLLVKHLEAIDKETIKVMESFTKISNDLTLSEAQKSAKKYMVFKDTRKLIEGLVGIADTELQASVKNHRQEFAGSMEGKSDLDIIALASGADNYTSQDAINSPIVRTMLLASETLLETQNETLENAYVEHQFSNPDIAKEVEINSNAKETLSWVIGSYEKSVDLPVNAQSIYESMVQE